MLSALQRAVYSITAFYAAVVYVNKANTQSVMQQCEGDNAVKKKRLCITKANGDIPLPCDIRGRFDFIIYRTTDPEHAYIVEHICITQYGITFTACNVKGHLDGGPTPNSDQNHYVCVTFVPALVTGVITREYKSNPQTCVLLGNHTGRTMLTSDHLALEPTIEGIVAYYADKILGPQFRQLAVTDPRFDAGSNKDVCDALLKWGTDDIRKILTQA
jgi:hypothetical protein